MKHDYQAMQKRIEALEAQVQLLAAQLAQRSWPVAAPPAQPFVAPFYPYTPTYQYTIWCGTESASAQVGITPSTNGVQQ
jgi:hypothetical protein